MKTLIWVVFFLSLVFRVRVIGWYLILFGLLEFGVRITILMVNLKFIQHLKSPADWALLLTGQLLVLLSALFTIDFSDVNSYTLLGQVTDPGKIYFTIYWWSVGLTVLVNSIMAYRVWFS